MSPVRLIDDINWPSLTGWKKIVKHTSRETCDSLEYFTDWPKRLGDGIFSGSEMYQSIDEITIPDFGSFRQAYLVVVTLRTKDPDMNKVGDYIKHQENLCYLVPYGINGRARFVGRAIKDEKMKLVFVISDPEFDRVLIKAEERTAFNRLLN